MTDKNKKSSLLEIILLFCSKAKIAGSTFGRHVVNNRKFVSRLRNGDRVTPETWEKVINFVKNNNGDHEVSMDSSKLHLVSLKTYPASSKPHVNRTHGISSENFLRFSDNLKKYLLFVSICNEKQIISQRVGLEIVQLHSKPPSVRIFDARMGDGSVLSSIMKELHHHFPTMPFYISEKEISLEDILLCLVKMPDRFYEHPPSVLVITNMLYSEVPRLKPKKVVPANSLV